MKIPETSANIGAYYGNEENGQWQPNGVIIDSGVGGGVVGSGDAGVHRAPVYPVHIPRGHIPGYVMAGAYYGAAFPAAPAQDDFADYMWMEHEEEFDKQVMQQLEEEALMEQCIEAMLEDEQRERQRPERRRDERQPHNYPTTSNGASLSLEETVSRSTLNPLAAEFVPTRTRYQAPAEDKSEAPTTEAAEAPGDATETAPPTDNAKDESQPPLPDPPEVSAADISDGPRRDKRPDKKSPKLDTKDAKKTKPTAAKSDTKVQPKKKEVKTVKSEAKVTDAPAVEPAPAPAPASAPVDSKPTLPSPTEETGPKPINYAAAAKANKPKKPATPPAIDKATIDKPTIDKSIDKHKKTDKPAVKTAKAEKRKSISNGDSNTALQTAD